MVSLSAAFSALIIPYKLFFSPVDWFQCEWPQFSSAPVELFGVGGHCARQRCATNKQQFQTELQRIKIQTNKNKKK